MSNAAIYARVSSARQKETETIRSQTAALRSHAEQLGLDVAEPWVFEDDGHSGASLVRPALERLRDLVCQVPVDVLLVHSPDRLARKYAYQALLIEEFAKAGTRVIFVKGPRSDSPEDALLVQFQGMIAEYERAQILERTRRGKTHRAKAGTINVLSGAPFGYRYVRKSEHSEARYEIVAHEAAIVAELFTRYADGGVAIADLTRWLTGLGVATRTGKARWDRSTVWGMLRNPAYSGRACFGKTTRSERSAGLNRTARLAGRATPRGYTVTDRAREDWLEIPVPALVGEQTWARVQRRLEDNKRFAARNSSNPSLLHGICACASCGYAYYRTSTRTTNKTIYYYRCLGSDDYRYEHGRVCANKPVRVDYLDTVVWDHITSLLADPALIRAEIDKRLDQVRTADPATAQRRRIDAAAAKTAAAITRLIGAYQEELISLDELRARMPELRARETALRHQRDALDHQLADREIHLKLADDLEGFLASLRDKTQTASTPERQRVLRLLVKDVLVGPDKIVIRHAIPTHSNTGSRTEDNTETDPEGETRRDCQLRWRSHDAALWDAEMARLAGRDDPERWEYAATLWAELSRPPDVAYCRWRQAEALVADPRTRSSAGAVLQTAWAQASGLGAVVVCDSLSALARRARLPQPAGAAVEDGGDRAARAPLLSPRELEVVRLLALGISNRDVAERLFVSPKTVETHVMHILQKLDAHDRVAAVTRAERLGMLTPVG